MSNKLALEIVYGAIIFVIIILSVADRIYQPPEEKPKNEKVAYALVLGFIILGTISIWALGCTAPSRVAWRPVSSERITNNGDPWGCVQEGLDEKGYVRWSVGMCPRQRLAN